MQQGRYAAQVVRARLRARETPPFRYRDKGNLATIGRAPLSPTSRGSSQRLHRLADLAAVHLWYLIGFQNRLVVLIRWSISFLTHGRGARLIVDRSEGDDTSVPPPSAV